MSTEVSQKVDRKMKNYQGTRAFDLWCRESEGVDTSELYAGGDYPWAMRQLLDLNNRYIQFLREHADKEDQ